MDSPVERAAERPSDKQDYIIRWPMVCQPGVHRFDPKYAYQRYAAWLGQHPGFTGHVQFTEHLDQEEYPTDSVLPLGVYRWLRDCTLSPATPLFFAEPWKFGFGRLIILLVLLFISYISGENLSKLKKWVLPLLVLGGISVYLGSRSLGATVILTAVVLWLRNRNFGKALLTRLNLKNILAGGVILGLALWGISSLYSYAAQGGYLGQEAQLKFIAQGGGQFGLLLGGRSEILASARAIADSPLIGHGSWARDPAYRVYLYRLIDLGYQRSQAEMDRYVNESDLIPAHSHFFQAWVWAGILGAIFWLVVLRLVIQALIKSNRHPNSLYIFAMFISISAIWDIFFSPFGSFMRIRWAIQLVILLNAIYHSNQIQQKQAMQ